MGFPWCVVLSYSSSAYVEVLIKCRRINDWLKNLWSITYDRILMFSVQLSSKIWKSVKIPSSHFFLHKPVEYSLCICGSCLIHLLIHFRANLRLDYFSLLGKKLTDPLKVLPKVDYSCLTCISLCILVCLVYIWM